MTAKYSYLWANARVQELREKYTRATGWVEKVLEISDVDLAKYLARGDELYPKLRDLIHFLDRSWNQDGKHPTDVTLFIASMAWARRKGVERVERRLDSLKSSTNIKKQTKEGSGGGGYFADLPGQLLLFPGDSDGVYQGICCSPGEAENGVEAGTPSH